jgi:hypothetical protein
LYWCRLRIAAPRHPLYCTRGGMAIQYHNHRSTILLPFPMLELFIVPILTCHLLALNLASAGPLACIWLRRRKCPAGHRPDQPCSSGRLGPSNQSNLPDQACQWAGQTTESAQAGQRLAWWSVLALLLGMSLGGVLLLPDNGPLWAALSRFPTKTYWSVASELAFSLICMISYAATWQRLGQRSILHAILGLLSAANLLYHFPPLMVVLGKIAADAGWTTEPVLERQMFLQLMLSGEVLSLSLHFVIASCIVTAVTLLWILAAQSSASERDMEKTTGSGSQDKRPDRRLVTTVALFAIACTLLQIPVGLWALLAQPLSLRFALMGNNIWASLCFAGGLMASLALLQMLISTVQGDTSSDRIRRIVATTIIVTMMMVVAIRSA